MRALRGGSALSNLVSILSECPLLLVGALRKWGDIRDMSALNNCVGAVRKWVS